MQYKKICKSIIIVVGWKQAWTRTPKEKTDLQTTIEFGFSMNLTIIEVALNYKIKCNLEND